MLDKEMIKIYQSGDTPDCIFTVCIGDEYIERWERISLPFWKMYCERHSLHLIAMIRPFDDTGGKRADWQKLLCGKAIKESKLDIKNVCFVDYDIIPNPYAPNIFKSHNEENISFVSQRKNLPYRNTTELMKLIAYYRNKYSNGKYPLDSYLFASPERIFRDHGLPQYEDYGCGGLFMFNIEKYSSIFEEAFCNDGEHKLSVSNPGEEVVLNHCIQGSGKCSWLSYSWQTLWWYEMPWNYPWLYDCKKRSKELTQEAIKTTLMRTNFLHFVGSWEKWAWEEVAELYKGEMLNDLRRFAKYKDEKSEAPNLGLIFPDSTDELKLISK